jgi:hypothetical protein
MITPHNMFKQQLPQTILVPQQHLTHEEILLPDAPVATVG